MKNRTPTRRSTRGATASRSQPAVEVQADEHQTDEYECPTVYRHGGEAFISRVLCGLLSLQKVRNLWLRMIHSPTMLLGRSNVR